MEGSQQEPVPIQEGDTVSRVIKRTVLRSEGDRKEVGGSSIKETNVIETLVQFLNSIKLFLGRKMCRSVGLQNSAATFMPVVAWQEGSGLNSHSGV